VKSDLGSAMAMIQLIRCITNGLFVMFLVGFMVFRCEAHEGHKPLPTRGVEVDLEKGILVVSEEATRSLGTETAEVQRRDTVETFSAYGRLTVPWNQWGVVSSMLEGRVVALYVREGQEVQQGELIAELECPEIERLGGEIRGLAKSIELSKRLLEDSQRATQTGALPISRMLEMQSELIQQEIQLEVSKGKWVGLGLDKGALESMLRFPLLPNRVRMRLTSPIGGKVVHTDVGVGKVVGVKEHLVEVMDTRSLWLRVEVLEKDIPRVRVGSEVVFRPLVGVGGVGKIGTEVGERRGKIEVIEPVLDPLRHVASAWVLLDNAMDERERMLPGVAGMVEVEGWRREGVFTVPADALSRLGAEYFVLVEQERTNRASTFRKQVVGLVGRKGGQVEVRSNDLFPGDRVVTQGSHALGHLFVQTTFRVHPQTAESIGLRSELVGRRKIRDVLMVDGIAKVPSQSRAMVSSPLAGQLERVLVKPGERVRAGSTIAWVSSLEYLDMQLGLRRAKLERDFRDRILERFMQVEGGVTQRQLMEARSLAEIAGLRVGEMEETLRVLGVSPERVSAITELGEVERMVAVVAPMDGVVVGFDKRLGHVVGRDEQLFEMQDVSQRWVEAYVPDSEIGSIRSGARARWSWGDATSLGEGMFWREEGQVVGMGSALSSGSQTFSVWVRGMDGDRGQERGELYQNMVVRVALEVGGGEEVEEVKGVPLESVVREGREAYVFVELVANMFERRRVVLGRSDDKYVEILRGLQEGERIVVSGVRELQIVRAAIR